MSIWFAAMTGWVCGMFTGRIVAWIALTYNRRKGGVTMLREKIHQTRRWVGKNFVAVGLILFVLSNSLGWFVILKQDADNNRQDEELNAIAVCTRAYLTKDAQARDERSEAVKPRDDAEAAFILAVSTLRTSDGSDPEADAKKVAALFRATDDFKKATVELNKVRAIDYPTYTCDKGR